MMDVIEFIGGMISGSVLVIVIKRVVSIVWGHTPPSTPAHDLKVAACLHASGRRTREQLYQDRGIGKVTELDASLMRLTASGLVDREFIGGGKVPHFELTPEGATILADD
jgi:hypothetical protein